MRRLFGLGVILSSGLIAACGSSSSPPSGTGGGGGVADGGGQAGAAAGMTGQGGGGAGGQPAGGAAGQASGGAGGQPAGGAGGQSVGGAPGACLDPSMFSSNFAIADSSFCAVALYAAPESIAYQVPTWGSHGGPLVVQPATGTGATLERWTAPTTGTTGTMTVQTTTVAAALPASTFLGAQALDLPFFGWTAISWTNPFPDSTGQFEMVASGAVATSYMLNGPYGVAAVPAASSLGRLLYTGLSPLGVPATSVAGLYAADACSSPAQALGTGTDCSASALVAAWGDSTGPIVTDSNGDAFAVMPTIATGMQEARGFLASSIARGAAATAGVSLFTMTGSAVALAALAPSAGDPGLVIFQPDDSSFTPIDVVEQKFTTSNGLVAMGTPTKLLSVASGQGLSFLVDGSQRLWVAVSGASSTTYIVLARQ
ncbi:MAG TPA: hypothetical protein VLC06_28775 [Polyangia bacterium]|nr:hypothetical protein [Polyangia bacterium]